jgi:hypothetical protein
VPRRLDHASASTVAIADSIARRDVDRERLRDPRERHAIRRAGG